MAWGAADRKSDIFKGGEELCWKKAYVLVYSGLWLIPFFPRDIILALFFEDLISW